MPINNIDNFSDLEKKTLIESLIDAAKKNDVTAFKKIVRENNLLLTTNIGESKLTLFHIAAIGGNLDLIKEYQSIKLNIVSATIHHHSQINTLSTENKTGFHYAAENGHLDCVNYFLNLKSIKNPENDFNKNGLTPLYLAAEKGQSEVVQAILEKFPQWAYEPCSIDGCTPLQIAAFKGHLNVVKVLLTTVKKEEIKNLDPENKKNKNFRAVFYALQAMHSIFDKNSESTTLSQHLEILKLLQTTDSNFFDCETDTGMKPVHMAAQSHTAGLKFLLSFNKDNVNCCSMDGNTPMHYAVKFNQFDNILYLVKKEALLFSINNEEKRPVDIGVNSSNPEIALFFLKENLKQYIQNKEKEIEAKSTKIHFFGYSPQKKLEVANKLNEKLQNQENVVNEFKKKLCQNEQPSRETETEAENKILYQVLELSRDDIGSLNNGKLKTIFIPILTVLKKLAKNNINSNDNDGVEIFPKENNSSMNLTY